MSTIKHYTIPVFIPELACPFQCIYCNQRVISGQLSIPANEEIIQTIEPHLATFNSNAHIELGFFGGNFTGISIDVQKELLTIVQPYIRNQKIRSIRISTRPDYISEENLSILHTYGVRTIELGVQSMDDEVLALTKRGYTAKKVEKAANLIKNYGFDLGMQMMVGLPGDTPEKSKETALKIVELGAVCARIYPTVVIKNTELAELHLQKKYTPLSIEQAINYTKEPLRIFEENNITVLRVGLHPTEGFINGNDFLEGPFHVSFKELVITDIWKDILLGACIQEADTTKEITIYVPDKEINYAVGYQSQNRKRLSQYFKKVNFKSNPELQGRNFYIESTKSL